MTDTDKTAALKTDVYKKAHNALLLCLDNKVSREVKKEGSAIKVWLKLETLYMTKSLANKLYLKKKLFTFYMHSDQHSCLLTSLPTHIRTCVETLLYGRENTRFGKILIYLNQRLKKRTDAKDDGDGLYVRGRSDHQDDMLIVCKSKSEIEYTKGLLHKEFDMKELGSARKILGMKIIRDRGS
ncbi:retrovirus-related pol polyprotein from transposon TNT 1-94 [Tanacetum coccineum]